MGHEHHADAKRTQAAKLHSMTGHTALYPPDKAEHWAHERKGEKPNAKVGRPHSDEAQDRKLFAKMIKGHEAEEHEGFDKKVGGEKSASRLDKMARGGRSKKGGNTNIVVVPHGGAQAPAPAPVAAAPAPVPRPTVMPPPGMGGVPVAPGMMRKRGGAIDGESTHANLKKFARHSKKHSYADGGKVDGHKYPHMKYGQQSGLGRLELAEHHKARRKGK